MPEWGVHAVINEYREDFIHSIHLANREESRVLDTEGRQGADSVTSAEQERVWRGRAPGLQEATEGTGLGRAEDAARGIYKQPSQAADTSDQ